MGQCTGDKACPIVVDILQDTCNLLPLHKRFLAQKRLGETVLMATSTGQKTPLLFSVWA